MPAIIWAIMLLAFGLGLVMLEFFIPSGGILGFLAVSSISGAIFLAFSSSGVAVGFAFVVVAAVGLPVSVICALKWLPDTPVGKRLLLRTPTGDEVLPEDDPRKKFHNLIGKLGTAKSAMMPGGAISIDQVTYEAVSDSGAVNAGQTVEVVQVRNNRLVVRKSDQLVTEGPSDDPLTRPIDSLGIDPFEDPLT